MSEVKPWSDPAERHIEDLGFYVIATPFEYWVEFTGYEVSGYSIGEDGEPYGPCFGVHEPSGGYGFSDRIEDAKPYFSGSVKWDGCSNWNFDELETVMLHGCSRQDLVNLGLILAACWTWTSELCPNWSEEVAQK